MITRILLPVDASEHSAKAVPLAGEFARKFETEIVVLHVRETTLARGRYNVETDEESHAIVDRVVKELKDDGLSARGELRACIVGHTAREINDTAGTEGADLIVMGSRGISDLKGIMLGSVAHKVLQLATVPVVIAR